MSLTIIARWTGAHGPIRSPAGGGLKSSWNCWEKRETAGLREPVLHHYESESYLCATRVGLVQVRDEAYLWATSLVSSRQRTLHTTSSTCRQPRWSTSTAWREAAVYASCQDARMQARCEPKWKWATLGNDERHSCAGCRGDIWMFGVQGLWTISFGENCVSSLWNFLWLMDVRECIGLHVFFYARSVHDCKNQKREKKSPFGLPSI